MRVVAVHHEVLQQTPPLIPSLYEELAVAGSSDPLPSPFVVLGPFIFVDVAEPGLC